MAEQEEPLYDFPEPSQASQFKGHQRSRGSLRSISVLDRLLLTVPVWLQLSINPATALHILQREPPGTFLVRNSRTSQKKVLCVRLTDNSEPSFVQQFDIQEEHSSFSLVTSAVNFPDLPRLISFYCGSRDVLPFPLELPEAIARAVSHKELESISHMGIEFWNSQLNVRGPRELPKPQKDPVRKPETAPTAPSPPAPVQAHEVQQGQDDQQNKNPNNQPSPPDAQPTKGDPSTALFKEFCPIKTRSPKELNYGSGIGALCFINPLFLQSLNAWSRKKMFKRSLKVRVSTESSTLLSPPLVPPPPPPLMPKCKSRCKVKTSKAAEPVKENVNFLRDNDQNSQRNPRVEENYTELPSRTRKDILKAIADVSPLPTVTESLVEDADYMEPSNMASASHPLTPYLSPKLPTKKSTSLSPSASPSVSPYQSPSPSPKALSPLLPFIPTTPVAGDAYDIPVSYLKTEQDKPEGDREVDRKPEGQEDVLQKELVQQMQAPSLPPKALSPLLPFIPTTPVAEDDYDIPVSYLKMEKERPEGERVVDRKPEDQENVLQKEFVQQMQAPSKSPKALSPLLPFIPTTPVTEDAHDIPVLYLKMEQERPEGDTAVDRKPEGEEDISQKALVQQMQAPSLPPKALSPQLPYIKTTPGAEDAYDIPVSFLKTEQEMPEEEEVRDRKSEGEEDVLQKELVQQMQAPSPSPKALSPQMPFIPTTPVAEDAYDIPVSYLKTEQERLEGDGTVDRNPEDEEALVQQVQAPSLPPKALSPLLPFIPTTPVAEDDYDIPVSYLKMEHKRPKGEGEVDRKPEGKEDVLQKELVQQMQAPSLPPKVLSPQFFPTTPMADDAYDIPVSYLKTEQERPEEEGAMDRKPEELVQQMQTASLNNKDSSSLSSQEEAQEPLSTVQENSASS